MFYWGYDRTPSAIVRTLCKSCQVLWPQLLLLFSTDFHQSFRILFPLLDIELILKGHDWILSTRVKTLGKSYQILWPQLLQFSTDFHKTFRILLSPFDMIGPCLPELWPFVNWSNIVTATPSVHNRFSSKFQDNVIMTGS